MVAGSALFPGLMAQLLSEGAGAAEAADPLAPKKPHFPAKVIRFLSRQAGGLRSMVRLAPSMTTASGVFTS